MTCAFAQKYNIGDVGQGGGIVFYYSEEGFDVHQPDGTVKKCNYLEVSKKAIGTTSWCPCKDKCYIRKINSGIGYGKINTYRIIKSEHSGRVTNNNCAAQACIYFYPLGRGGKYYDWTRGDWFLPSKDEFALLIEASNYHSLGLEFSDLGYAHWTSSQCATAGKAWCSIIAGGASKEYEIYKSSKKEVRPIRAF